MFKLPLDSLLTVAQASPQLIEVQARSQLLHTTNDTQPACPHLVYHNPQPGHSALSNICQQRKLPMCKSCSSNRVDIAASEPVVLKSLAMFRCCCRTGVLASFVCKQEMQAVQSLSCTTPLPRYIPSLRVICLCPLLQQKPCSLLNSS